MRLRIAMALVLTGLAMDGLAFDAWDDLLVRAEAERKPIVVFFRPERCGKCDAFERESLTHPTIARRLPRVVFGRMAVGADADPSIVLFDRGGTLRARWALLPDTMDLGIILDSAIAVQEEFDCALELTRGGAPGEGALQAALALARLQRVKESRAALAQAMREGGRETREKAVLVDALLDAKEGNREAAIARLERAAADGLTPIVDRDVKKTIEALRSLTVPALQGGSVRILPLAYQVVSGWCTVKTRVDTAAVEEVAFFLDGREVRRSRHPPFLAHFDFGEVPERHVIRAVAFDRKGKEIGRHERVVNDGGEAFWLRLESPVEGPVSGDVKVEMNVRVPPARRIRRVAISWNDAERAVLQAPPWSAVVHVEAFAIGVLRAVAELDDGRTSEDAVLLNASGAAGESRVQLVGLPITVIDSKGTGAPLRPDRIKVREGGQVRPVEAVGTAEDTPLTVGVLIDVSESMQTSLPDVQEAAIRFLESLLNQRDRAFLVSFASSARLLQPATSDAALLSREIMRLRPNGLTALNDAIALGLLQLEGITGRRALVVFSDGLDRTSRYRSADVRELARRVNVPIHVIESVPVEESDGSLLRLAAATGGTAQRVESLDELPRIYATIAGSLRSQILAFIRTDPAHGDGEWRPVSVEVSGGGVRILAPAGYSITP